MRTRKKISQREALRLRKRVNDLLRERAAQRASWSSEYPGGVNVGRINLMDKPETNLKVTIAMKFSDVLVAKAVNGYLELFAIPR